MAKKDPSLVPAFPGPERFCKDRDEQVRFSVFCICLEAAKTWQRIVDRGGPMSAARLPIGSPAVRGKPRKLNLRAQAGRGAAPPRLPSAAAMPTPPITPPLTHAEGARTGLQRRRERNAPPPRRPRRRGTRPAPTTAVPVS
jgi:hypothetical protein